MQCQQTVWRWMCQYIERIVRRMVQMLKETHTITETIAQ